MKLIIDTNILISILLKDSISRELLLNDKAESSIILFKYKHLFETQLNYKRISFDQPEMEKAKRIG
jgi:predicted nucleic acid-binding protein